MNDGGILLISIVSAVSGVIGIWMLMRAIDAIRKNYLLDKYPVLAKAIINDKYTNKNNRTIDASNVYYIKFSFCATDRDYATYTISKMDHQMISRAEWMNLNVGDFIEIIYCAKDITYFALSSEQKMRQTRLIPLITMIGSVPFLFLILVPALIGSGGGTFFSILITISAALIIRAEKISCCDRIWQNCKEKKIVLKVVSELTTGCSPELEIPSGSDEDTSSLNYDETDQINHEIDTDANQIV